MIIGLCIFDYCIFQLGSSRRVEARLCRCVSGHGVENGHDRVRNQAPVAGKSALEDGPWADLVARHDLGTTFSFEQSSSSRILSVRDPS